MPKFIEIINKALESLRLMIHSSSVILLNCWIELSRQRVMKRNLGDELNYYLLSALTGKKIINRLSTFSKVSDHYYNYICIGSIIEEFSTPKSIIWGAGAIAGGKYPLRNQPYNVLAVRGKLTRQYLIENDIECPEIYGDPALLLPLVYYPDVAKKYKLGIIPHVSEIQHQYVQTIVKQGAKLIRLDNYNNWTDIIDEIKSCEFIISSSLHGLILCDVYSVPNIWVCISGNLLGGTFKFLDYFSGVDRKDMSPYIIDNSTNIIDLINLGKNYRPIYYNPIPLIESAPWTLNIDKTKLKNVKSYTQYNCPSI